MKLVFAIPTIIRADLLAESLQDLAQRVHAFSGLVLVDNGWQTFHLPETLKPITLIVKAGRNLGVAGSWNLASDIAFHTLKADYVVHLNDDIVLGQDPEDIKRELLRNGEPDLMIGPFHWCAFALKCGVFESIGKFDVAFFPAYYEDRDFLYRAKLGKLGVVGNAKSLDPFHKRNASSGGEQVGPRDHYMKKWGGVPGSERFTIPFDGVSP
jgi:GT2 family glycosyltransferase